MDTETSTEITTEVKETAIIKTDREFVEENLPANTPKDIKDETLALFEAIKRRAQLEANHATEFTRENYLKAVREARAKIEQEQLFDPERIAYTFKLLQMDAQQNWEKMLKEMNQFGDRLAEAAKAAWEVLTAPRPQDPDDKVG